MEVRKIHGCAVPASRIAFGGEPLGGFEWGDVDLDEVERALETAIDLGVTLFDTADCYGRGESERRLGRILQTRRASVLISTKFGVRFDPQNRVYYDNSVDYVEEALDASLRRLNTDYIDLYQLHWPDQHTPLEAVFDRLEQLCDKGKIRAYGVTNVKPQDLLPHVERTRLASFSLQYSLAHREQEQAILDLCKKGMVFLSWGSLGQGILSGHYGQDHQWPDHDRRRRPQYENFHGEKLAKNLALVDRLWEVTKDEQYTAPSVGALRFILDRIPSSIAIVGIKSRAQIKQNVSAGTKPMSERNLALLMREA